jgi:ATP-dependent DNA ligase
MKRSGVLRSAYLTAMLSTLEYQPCIPTRGIEVPASPLRARCLGAHGDGLRKIPLSMRKTNLARLLARRLDGIFVEPFEMGLGPTCFGGSLQVWIEGLVSKRRDSVYRSGRSPSWVKVKNRSHPAIQRFKDAFA